MAICCRANGDPARRGRRVAACDGTCAPTHKKPPSAEGALGGSKAPRPSTAYGNRGVQFAGRPRALHSSLGTGSTWKMWSPVTGFGNPMFGSGAADCGP